MQSQAPGGQGALAIRLNGFGIWCGAAEVMTDTFMPASTLSHIIYEQQASPLIYPGQTLSAIVETEDLPAEGVEIALRLRVNGAESELVIADGPSQHFRSNETHQLKSVHPECFQMRSRRPS